METFIFSFYAKWNDGTTATTTNATTTNGDDGNGDEPTSATTATTAATATAAATAACNHTTVKNRWFDGRSLWGDV